MTCLRDSGFTVDQLSDAIAQYDFQQDPGKEALSHRGALPGFRDLQSAPGQRSAGGRHVAEHGTAMPGIHLRRRRTVVGMIPPTELLALVSDDDAVANSAREVEISMKAMIDTLAQGRHRPASVMPVDKGGARRVAT